MKKRYLLAMAITFTSLTGCSPNLLPLPSPGTPTVDDLLKADTVTRVCTTEARGEWGRRSKNMETEDIIVAIQGVTVSAPYQSNGVWSADVSVSYTMQAYPLDPIHDSTDWVCKVSGTNSMPEATVDGRPR